MAPDKADIDPGPDDFMLLIRDGVCYLRGPLDSMGERAPDDLLVLIGVASLFTNERFRSMMIDRVEDYYETGGLEGVLVRGMVQ